MQIIEFSLARTLIVCLMIIGEKIMLGTPVSDSTVNSDFEGGSLVNMGAAMNRSLLRLLGRTFEKLEQDLTKDIDTKTKFALAEIKKDSSSLEQRMVSERKELIDIMCQLQMCTEWTAWSDCTARMNGTYGAQTRSRTCGVNSIKLCPNSGQKSTESDARVCEGQKNCPRTYTLTKNGFCIGVYKVQQHTWKSAHDTCKQEGGYLVNIDSELIAEDLNNTLQQNSLANSFWIDGTRTLPSGAWRYEYGPRDPAYTNWKPGEPDATDGCKVYVLYLSLWQSWGRPCTDVHYFVCEII